MKPVYILSLLALTVLSACGNKEDPAAQLSGGAVINDQGGPEVQAGLREANRARSRHRLPRLQADATLMAAAQERANQMCGAGQTQTPGFGGDDYYRGQNDNDGNDGVSALPAMGQANGMGYGRPHQNPQYPQQQGGYVENVARGMRGVRAAEQVFLRWQQVSMYSQNLMNPGFRRQGIGYCDGVWVQLLAN